MARSYEEAETDYEQQILENIRTHGWFCTCVFDPNGERPSFAYSVGFTKTLNCPEFIVFGLEPKTMQSMLWEAFEQIRDGKGPEDGQVWHNLINDYECISRSVHPTNIVRDYFNSAMWFWNAPNEQNALKAFQLVWPGNGSGLFPWDDNCPQVVCDYQPPLYLPNRAFS